jgi:glutamine amidotransferase
METLLVHPENSLLAQSKHSLKRKKSVNGDGFGVGWYPMHNDPEPGVFVSIEPAWSNRNLKQISSKIIARNFFAHVRDASEDILVSLANCHPFHYGKFLWMHNGQLDEFFKIKRDMVRGFSDKAFDFIEGHTDSEYSFAMFLDELNFNDNATPDEIKKALIATIEKIMRLRKKNNADGNALLNFAITNGTSTFVTRHCTEEGGKAATLYYTRGCPRENEQGEYHIGDGCCCEEQSVIISSEPLTYEKDVWREVKSGTMLEVNEQSEVLIHEIELPPQSEL